MSRLPAFPIVYCISKGDTTAANFEFKKTEICKKVERASGQGVNFFQIREKRLSARLLFELTQAVVEAASPGLKILVNGRADIALAARADGVHLPTDGVPVENLRKCTPANFIIGVSAHSVREVRSAKACGADFAAFAPIFKTPGKDNPAGLEMLREVCDAVNPFPVIALGGVNASNVEEILRNGAAGYAAIRYLNDILED